MMHELKTVVADIRPNLTAVETNLSFFDTSKPNAKIVRVLEKSPH